MKVTLMSDATTLARILGSNRTIAVVGLSANESRPSFFAAKYMQEHGYRVIPVNPAYDSILGEKCYGSLREITEPVGIVDVFRRTEDVMPIAQDAIAIGARCLWQQLGVNNAQAVELVTEQGMDAIVNHCVKIEYARLFGGLNYAGVNTRVISARRLVPPVPGEQAGAEQATAGPATGTGNV